MSVYNISNRAIQVVQAGSPETLIVNKSTKNSVVLGRTSGVGIGTGLDDTPLGPYESFAVNGASDVWAIQAALNAPATVITMENAVLWTPQQIQPNIIDSHSPYTPGPVNTTVGLTVPPGAQGLFLGWGNPNGFTSLIITGDQSGLTYAVENPSLLVDQQLWVPILSDADTTVHVATNATVGPRIVFVWIMTPFMAGQVETGQVGDVNIVNVGTTTGSLLVAPAIGSVFSTTPNDSRQLFPNNNVPFASSVSAGATITLVSAGSNTWLHNLQYDIDPGTNTTANWILQDTAGTVITNLHFEGVSTTNNPSHAPIDFKGLPLAAGRGVVLKNNSGATSAIFGNLTYSQ